MIHTLLIDFDGVLTDGKKSIDHTGHTMFKNVHSRDNRAIRELVAHGWTVVIVTADTWKGAEAYAHKLGCIYAHARDKSNLPFENYAAIGDDAWDVQMLKKAAIAYCPSDADSSVISIPNITVLKTKGGHGVIAELAPLLLNVKQII